MKSTLRSHFAVADLGVIYLDSAAKSLTPSRVVKSIERYYLDCDANCGRSVHRLARIATEKVEEARISIADLINATPEEIILLRNTTEAIGTVCHGLKWEQGDEIVTTLGEHHSNYLPWLRLQQTAGVRVIAVVPREDGSIDLGELDEAVVPGKTKLVAVSHVSNSLGTILPVREICRVAATAGALSLVDGAQSVPHLPVDVNEIGCDFFAWSGHKMFGPTGTGALYCRSPLMEQLIPLHAGGGSIENVDVNSFTFNYNPPYMAHESGTPDVAGIIGFGEAADYLKELKKDLRLSAEIRSLVNRTAKQLRQIPGVHVAGPVDPLKRSGIVSFWIDGISPHKTGVVLDEDFNVLVRSGHHCALPMMREVLRLPRGLVRASFHYYSTQDDVDKLINAVSRIAGNAE